MVIQMTGAEEVLLTLCPTIKNILPRRYGIKVVPIEKYVEGGKGAGLLQVSANTLLYRLSLHAKAHALLINKKLLIHPDGLMLLLKDKTRKMIKGELKRKYESQD